MNLGAHDICTCDIITELIAALICLFCIYYKHDTHLKLIQTGLLLVVSFSQLKTVWLHVHKVAPLTSESLFYLIYMRDFVHIPKSFMYKIHQINTNKEIFV